MEIILDILSIHDHFNSFHLTDCQHVSSINLAISQNTSGTNLNTLQPHIIQTFRRGLI